MQQININIKIGETNIFTTYLEYFITLSHEYFVSHLNIGGRTYLQLWIIWCFALFLSLPPASDSFWKLKDLGEFIVVMKIFCTGRYQMCKDLRRYWAGGSRWICSTLARFIIFSRSPMCICRSRRWINEFVHLPLHRFAAFPQCADLRRWIYKWICSTLASSFCHFSPRAITRLLHKCQIASKGWTQLSNFKSNKIWLLRPHFKQTKFSGCQMFCLV